LIGNGIAARRPYPLTALRLARWLRRERIEVVHAHLFDASILGMIAAVLARTPVRIVTRHHGELHHLLRKPLHVFVDRLAARLAHRVVAVSQANRQMLIEQEGVPPSKIEVIHNGILLERFEEAARHSAAAIRQGLGLTGEIVLTVPGRLSWQKGQRQVLAALPAISLAISQRIVLLLAGEGPDKGQLELEAVRLGVRERVLLLGFRDDLPRVLAASDAVVLPSLMEPFGQVLVEAMAVGFPVVATATAGPAEIVTDGVDGLLVPPGSAERLAGAVIRLLNDSALADRLVSAGRRRAAEFDIRRIASRHELLYREVRASPRGLAA